MSDLCGQPHPETGQACHREGNHPTHLAGFGSKRVSWENEGWQPPPQYQPKVDRVKLTEMARTVAPPERRMARTAAEIRRDEGMRSAAKGAGQEWAERAHAAISRYLAENETFFVDDFWEATDLDRPEDSRAIGPVISRVARDGLMERTGTYRPSSASNLSAKPVWRSLLFSAPTEIPTVDPV